MFLPRAFENNTTVGPPSIRANIRVRKIITILTMFRELFVILRYLYRVIGRESESLFDLMENASTMRRGNNSPLNVVFIIIGRD